MPRLIYDAAVVAVGEYVKEYLQQNKLILFADNAPPDIAEYCALHRGGNLIAQLHPGYVLAFNYQRYFITAVGNVAAANLASLGHITVSFDGAICAELPGTVHVDGEAPAIIVPGDRITISESRQ